jgi:hypothetical protein
MDETSPEAVAAAAIPLVKALILRTLDGDRTAAARALHALWQLPEIGQYAAFTTLAESAVLGIPRGLQPGVTWVPRMRLGHPPRQINPDEHPAAAFVLRFIASVLNRDDALRMDLWAACIRRDPGVEVSAAEIRDVAAAFVLMVELAAAGFRRETHRRRRTHQHPNARRRDQRRR